MFEIQPAWQAVKEFVVRIAAGIVTVLALVCTAGLATRVAGSSAAAVSRNMVVVSSASDVVNGNVSSLSALKARPGRDGISLREALTAADRTGGSATVYIMFSARLNGKTIEVRSQLPVIHRNHLVLEGVAPNGAPARVTLDGRLAPHLTLGELLMVQASEVTIRWLRFGAMTPPRDQSGPEAAVVVRPGRNLPPHASLGPRQITNVQIVDNVFDNRATVFPSGVPLELRALHGLIVGTPVGESTANTRLSGITIARNTFLHYVGNSDAVGVWMSAPGTSATGVVIEDNSFAQDDTPIELAEGGSSPRQEGARIIGNTITGGSIGITLNEDATNGTTDGTLIEGNAISGVRGAAINLDAAAYDPSFGGKPAGGVISNTQIVNNVIRGELSAGDAGIYMEGGNITSSPPSRVSAVTIENDTFVNDQPGFLFISVPNGPGASGNSINDVTVRNTILYEPSGRPLYVTSGAMVNLAPDVLTNSLISGPGWAGTSGNITGDPLFINEPFGDYHLAATSPAINAGTTIGAPSYDLDGARRDAQPDIGAFEFGAIPRPLLTVTVAQLGGNGTVTSNPAAINCGTACSARFDPNTTITLVAKPDRGSRFLDWQNGCSGKARCTIRLNRAESVIARFAP